MEITKTSIEGLVVIEPKVFEDPRGYFMESYKDACTECYGYLFIDLTQGTSEDMRLRTQIFPGQTQLIYVPKG